MAFEIDALIVFADRDDQTTGSGAGWVSTFKKFLETVLEQVMGEKPKVMLKSEFDSLISPKLDNTGVLICILSPDFVQSRPCLEYIEKFRAATSSTSSQINRIFKVFKSPVSFHEQPPLLNRLFGYEMYQLDPDSGDVREYSDYFSSDAERQYWMEMTDLSYDVQETLYHLKSGKSIHEIKRIYGKKTIYLAQTCHDLSVQRNVIHRELQRLGYTILPEQSLPGTLDELEKVVRNDLASSRISIHLIGADYGDVPSGTDRSVQDLQYRLAAERSIVAKERMEDFSRLIWITPNLSHSSERQTKFIEGLKRDVEASEGAEILQTQLEDFKSVVREELEDSLDKKSHIDTKGQSIYLIHDKVDHQAIKPYVELILNSGFNLLMPDFEGELLELRQKHIENLRLLDGAIIFKGKVNEQWVKMKILDLLKAPGFGRKKPILGQAIVTTSGSTVNKEFLPNRNLRVIDGDLPKSIESLRLFLKQLKD